MELERQSENGEENICNLLREESISRPRKMKYVSKHNDKTKREIRECQRERANFGYQHYEADDPCQYLRKHTKKPMTTLPEPSKIKLIGLSKVDDHKPVSFRRQKRVVKDYICENKKELQDKRNAHVSDHKYADTKGGDTHLLQPSGLQLRYVFKSDFGKTPNYLLRREHQMRRMHELEREQRAREAIEARKARQVPEEERLQLLQGLKENWAQVNHTYAMQSMVTDNAGKRRRKEQLERQLAALEKDIELLEANSVILIASPRDTEESTTEGEELSSIPSSGRKATRHCTKAAADVVCCCGKQD